MQFWRVLLHLACALPLAYLVLQLAEVGGLRLGPNPQLLIRDVLGEWGLRLLLLTLSMTPLRWLTGKPWPLQYRRLLGLWSFAYLALHFITYFLLDRSLDLAVIIEDITGRPFITIGFAAFVLMIPLAVTSTVGWRRRLGARWVSLHRLAYLIAILGCWHFYWLVKKDVRESLVYCAILAVLLGFRLWKRFRFGFAMGSPATATASTSTGRIQHQTGAEHRTFDVAAIALLCLGTIDGICTQSPDNSDSEIVEIETVVVRLDGRPLSSVGHLLAPGSGTCHGHRGGPRPVCTCSQRRACGPWR